MRNVQAILMGLGVYSCLWATVAGCGKGEMQQMQQPSPDTATEENTGKPGEVMAFNHDDQVGDPFADGRQLPAAKAERQHVCSKVRYSALANVLQSRGVDLGGQDPASAGQLFQTGNLVLGVANFGARVPESDRNTTGGITRLFDILIAAADEIITNMPARPECMVNGVGAQLFNQDNTCNFDGFTCLLGMPVTPAQLQTCSDMVKDFTTTMPSDVAAGKRLAVAAMAAPIYLCE